MTQLTDQGDWAIYRYEATGRMRFVTRIQCPEAQMEQAIKIMAEEHGETLIARPYHGSARPPRETRGR